MISELVFILLWVLLPIVAMQGIHIVQRWRDRAIVRPQIESSDSRVINAIREINRSLGLDEWDQIEQYKPTLPPPLGTREYYRMLEREQQKVAREMRAKYGPGAVFLVGPRESVRHMGDISGLDAPLNHEVKLIDCSHGVQ